MSRNIKIPRLTKRMRLGKKDMSWIDPTKGAALVKPPAQSTEPNLLTNIVRRFLKLKGLDKWDACRVKYPMGDQRMECVEGEKRLSPGQFTHFRYMLSGLVQEFRQFLDKLRMYGMRVPYLTDEQIGRTLEAAIDEAEHQEGYKSLKIEVKGRILKRGDRIEGVYRVPGIGESEFTGIISELEADQGSPRGVPSSFSRAWVKLDKPIILNQDHPNDSFSRRESLILTVSPKGEVQEDAYLQLKSMESEQPPVYKIEHQVAPPATSNGSPRIIAILKDGSGSEIYRTEPMADVHQATYEAYLWGQQTERARKGGKSGKKKLDEGDPCQRGERSDFTGCISASGETGDPEEKKKDKLAVEEKGVKKGTCKPGERADVTGCTPASYEQTQREKKPGEQTGHKPGMGHPMEKGKSAAKKLLGRLQQFENFVASAPGKVKEKLNDLAMKTFIRVNDAAESVMKKIPHSLHEDIKEAAQVNLVIMLAGEDPGIHGGVHSGGHGAGELQHAGMIQLPEFHFDMHLENEWSFSTGMSTNWKIQLGAALGSYVLSKAVIGLCQKMGSPKICFGYGKGKPAEHKALDNEMPQMGAADEAGEKAEQSVQLSIALMDAMATAARVKMPYTREGLLENAKKYLAGEPGDDTTPDPVEPGMEQEPEVESKCIGIFSEKDFEQVFGKDIQKGTCKPGERADLTHCTPASYQESDKPKAKPSEEKLDSEFDKANWVDADGDGIPDKVKQQARAKAMSRMHNLAKDWLKENHAEGRQLTPTELAQFSMHLAKDLDEDSFKVLQARCVEGRCPKTKERYTLSIYSDKNVDTYLLRWGEGIPADWHDHGEGRDGAKVGIYVVDGSPENDLLTPKGKVIRQQLQPGHHYSLGAPYIHKMIDTGKPSWTVHSYSGPKGGLNHMNFYQRDAKDNIILKDGHPVKASEWIADPENLNKPAPVIPENNPELGKSKAKKSLNIKTKMAPESREIPVIPEYKVYKEQVLLRRVPNGTVSAWIKGAWEDGHEEHWDESEHASAGDVADLTTDPETLDQFGIVGEVIDGKVHSFEDDSPKKDLESLYKQIAAGGFTYSITSGTSPKKGFIVSPFPERSFAKPVKDLKPLDVLKYAVHNRDLLTNKDYYLGAWNDSETGKVFLDVVIDGVTDKKAEELALKHDQIAYYDIEHGKTVTVNRAATSGGAAKGLNNGKASGPFPGETGRSKRLGRRSIALPKIDGERAFRGRDSGSKGLAGVLPGGSNGTGKELDLVPSAKSMMDIKSVLVQQQDASKMLKEAKSEMQEMRKEMQEQMMGMLKVLEVIVEKSITRKKPSAIAVETDGNGNVIRLIPQE